MLLIITLSFGLVAAEIVVQDAAGNTVRLPRPAERVVSLAPHNTENLFAAGARGTLVGATSYSDYPPAAQEVPRVGGYSGLDLEAIAALRPDLILAWESGNRREDIERLRALGFTIYLSEPRRLEDIASEIEALGRLTGTTETARRFASGYRERLRALRQRYRGQRPLRVFYEVWHRPLITINGEQIISKAITLCGGRNIFAHLATLAPSVDIEAVIAADPDVIVTATGNRQEEIRWREAWSRWSRMAAVARNHIYSLSPDLLQRQGPRILDGVAQLCDILSRARR